MKKRNVLSVSARMIGILAFLSTSTLAALQVNYRDEGSGDAQWAKPRIFVTNTGNASSTISSIRYYFDKVSGKNPVLEVWDAGGAPGIIVDAGAQYYAEINMGGVQLAAGESLRWGNGILFGIHNSDWSAWNKTGAVSISVQSVDQVIPPPTPPNNDDVINSIGSDCWENYAALGKTTVQLLDRAVVNGSVGSAGTIQINTDADVNQGSLYANGAINLLDRVYVGGDVRSANAINRGTGVQITGTTASYSTVNNCAVNAPTGTATGGTTNITVAQNQTLTIPPGTYGAVEVGYYGTLVLSAGQYVFSSLNVKEDAAIRLTTGNQAVKVLTIAPFVFGNRSRVTMDGQDAPRRFQITSVSTSTSTIGYDARVKGTIAAPSSAIQILDRAIVTGGVVASSINGGYDTQINYAPRLATVNLPPTVQVIDMTVPTMSTTSITAANIIVTDPDTPLDQIVMKYVTAPMGGYLTKNGITMAPGSTFTLAELASGQIAFKITYAQVSRDLIWFEAFDGVNTVRFRLMINITI